MFRELVNEARLDFQIGTASPLAIRSGQENPLDPTIPDMQCVRAWRDGHQVVYIPGSSLKGVMRARAEQIVRLLRGNPCDPTDRGGSCSRREKELRKLPIGARYRQVCPVCRLFGCTSLASRVAFPDAFPVGEVHTGVKSGVAINRFTGGAQRSHLFEQETVESATFAAALLLSNFELWQLKLLLWVLRDMDDGYVALGGGSSRGLGRVRIGEVRLTVRDYRDPASPPASLRGLAAGDTGGALSFHRGAFYWEATAAGLSALLDGPLADVDVAAAVARREGA